MLALQKCCLRIWKAKLNKIISILEEMLYISAIKIVFIMCITFILHIFKDRKNQLHLVNMKNYNWEFISKSFFEINQKLLFQLIVPVQQKSASGAQVQRLLAKPRLRSHGSHLIAKAHIKRKTSAGNRSAINKVIIWVLVAHTMRVLLNQNLYLTS